MKVKFVNYDLVYKELSWEWLNDDEIKYLTITPDFTKEQQDKWFVTLKNRTDYKVWGVSYAGYPVGVVGLKNINDVECEYFGYIGNKKYWGLGIGSEMVKFAKNIAKEMGEKKIYLRVLQDNVRAIRLYQNNDFKLDVVDNKVMLMLCVLG